MEKLLVRSQRFQSCSGSLNACFFMLIIMFPPLTQHSQSMVPLVKLLQEAKKTESKIESLWFHFLKDKINKKVYNTLVIFILNFFHNN